jgi:hypothetical protein
MDLDAAAEELYAGSPEEFVGRRTALVKQARQQKDRALATAIGGLRKPTRTAWLVNLLAREAGDDVAALLDLGAALRQAQAERDGAALRTLSGRRRAAIDALTRRAGELGRASGHPPTEATTAEVAATLQAALGEPEVADQVRRGRLATGAVYGGFGTPTTDEGDAGSTDLMAALAASMPSGAGGKPAASQAEPPEDEVGRRRRAALRAAWDEARSALEQAQTEADDATEHADELAERVEQLRAELDEAARAETEARTAARTAREHLREVRGTAEAAETAWRDAEAEAASPRVRG